MNFLTFIIIHTALRVSPKFNDPNTSWHLDMKIL